MLSNTNQQMLYPNKCVHRIFEERVHEFPQNIAVKFAGKALTYQQLNHKANRLAHYLETQNIDKGELVGVFVERSIEMITAFLAILKIGAVYVPLDPVYPLERLKYIVDETKLSVILSSKKLDQKIGGTKTIYLDEDYSSYSTSDFENKISPQDLAYVIYTSGSTGVPKGACIHHQGIVRLVKNTNYIDIQSHHVIAHTSSACFDPATFEIWGGLLNGGQVVIIPKSEMLVPSQFKKYLEENSVSIAFITTSFFNQLVSVEPDIFGSLEFVLTGGETVHPKWMKIALQSELTNLLNMYGPTENSVFSTFYYVKEIRDDVPIPIGKAISNTTVYILNEKMEFIEDDQVGEIYVGGDGVGLGYFNREDLTEKAFVLNPFGSGKLYKTGDLARYTSDRQIEFVGRIDNQVKIRGFRIELEEIEKTLATIPEVNKTVVLAKKYNDNNNDLRLVGYVEVSSLQDTCEEKIKQYLQQKLPQHMIPPYFKIMTAFPLTINQKIDRKALAQMDLQSKRGYTAYNDTTEEKIINLWSSFLGIPISQIDSKSDFFLLGGNSLLVTQMLLEIKQVFGCDISLESIYENPSLSNVTNLINQNEKRLDLHVTLLKAGSGIPLFIVPDVAGDTASYTAILKHLKGPQPIYGFYPPGIHDDKKPLKTVREISAFYLQLMTKIQEEGPYMLMGYSFGATIAYEMAQQLMKNGKKVAVLALLDPDSSGFSFHPQTFVNSMVRMKSIWHNALYFAFPGRKMGRALLKEMIVGFKLLWQIELSLEKLLSFKTENEQYEHCLNMLKQERHFASHVTLEKFKKISDVAGVNYLANFIYFPKKYPGKVAFFRPRQKTKYFTVVNYKKWSKLVKCTFYDIEGHHFNFFSGPGAKEIGTKIQLDIDSVLRNNK
ncbi:amino acid adenylation domain-containing protein [Candidatus Uabimicrobium sp. HlEnr_7]|uniref:amino acid adenylation domain-containing protein n=1 Tax=Candidatus Uabimicrobium helgolandensis TaxID=3095367 RepID=UPI00355825B4